MFLIEIIHRATQFFLKTQFSRSAGKVFQQTKTVSPRIIKMKILKYLKSISNGWGHKIMNKQECLSVEGPPPACQ